jgi:hypothetical protein
VVEGGVAQLPSGPGGALHRAYHIGKQLRERLCLLPTHLPIGDVERQPTVRLRVRRLLLAGCVARGEGQGARFGRVRFGLPCAFSLALLLGGRAPLPAAMEERREHHYAQHYRENTSHGTAPELISDRSSSTFGW